MRTKFLRFLLDQAEQDPSCYLLVGDVGFSVVEPFAQRFPDRYINTGIAEQNMIGIAAGLAMAGKRVYAYSITNFACMRPFEQIRNDVCYQNLPVTVVGNGSGFSYASAGATHHAIEDVAIMRALPEMTVVSPGSFYELEQLLPAIHAHKKPVYLRLGPCENKPVYHTLPVTLGKAVELIPHQTALLVASGSALDAAWQIVHLLQEEGIMIGLVSMPTIKPLDEQFFLAKEQLSFVATLEEHSVIGGLGEAVARCLIENSDHKIRFKAFGINDYYTHVIGTRTYLNEQAGLSIERVAGQLKTLLTQSTKPKVHNVSGSLRSTIV